MADGQRMYLDGGCVVQLLSSKLTRIPRSWWKGSIGLKYTKKKITYVEVETVSNLRDKNFESILKHLNKGANFQTKPTYLVFEG